MDIAYLRAHPEHLPTFLTHQRIRETPVRGGSISSASRLTLDDGHSVFTKTWPESAANARPDGFFEAEAAGLAWLGTARSGGGIATPTVIVALPQLIAFDWINEAAPSRAHARAFGAALACTHRAGAERFGAPWSGYIGALPLDNTRSDGPWSAWFGERRLRPYLRLCAEHGALGRADITEIEQLISGIGRYAGPADAEPPARTHGDLWPGNLLWSAELVYAIDPAAHGGHRETDIAELMLFGGAPFLDDIIGGYEDQFPLAHGWRGRVPLHQLHLLLVHAAMFGAAYRGAVMSAVRATVKR